MQGAADTAPARHRPCAQWPPLATAQRRPGGDCRKHAAARGFARAEPGRVPAPAGRAMKEGLPARARLLASLARLGAARVACPSLGHSSAGAAGVGRAWRSSGDGLTSRYLSPSGSKSSSE